MEKRFSRTFVICAEILILISVGAAQDIEATLKIESVSPAVVRVEGTILKENSFQSSKNWAFLRSIAGIENLGDRISDLSLSDKNKRSIPVKKLIAGEYLADEEADFFSYRVNISPLTKVSSMAHISWLKDEQGLLMLDDLLPQFRRADNQPVSARIKFDLPNDWKISGVETASERNSFIVANIEKAVFLVGKNWREKEIVIEKSKINFAFAGEWQFSDEEALQSASEILREYRNIFGEIPNEKSQIFLIHFPKETKIGNWEAETRGASVVILSSDMPFKSQSIQRLHEQFRHELFHLWMPNNLALSGNYDWFYEGFALYQSLRTAVQLNRIRFEDFLDTLGRAYDLDSFQEQRVSLIEASKTRWSGANPQLYARGMIVAFLADVALLRESNGKRSLSDVFRQIYQKYRKPNPSQDGNAAILSILESYAELRPLVERSVKGAAKTEWQTDLESVGIETGKENFPTNLAVKAKLKGRQKDLLDKLGYNNWRKSSDKSK